MSTKQYCIIIPTIVRSMFETNSVFYKKIPIKLRIFKKDVNPELLDYRESPINMIPFQKDYLSQSKHPWIDRPNDPAVRNDIRYYDYINGPVQGNPLFEHE